MGIFRSTIPNHEEEDVDGNQKERKKDKRKGEFNMLESNTDRSYFMIGAVVVAGIVIAAAVWIFDVKIFGETGVFTKAFESISGTASKAIENIGAPRNPNETIPNETIMGLGMKLKSMLNM